ncbi:MAG: hypothetical protein ACPGRG_12370 [Marinomonas sp.]|uniref:hypothetical protein n=1 Tax=Marinomonas TaxID=28253 RepID=UPI0022437D90|nr:hypothetical protein [Marinomonas pontica]MCW8355613.1 hypothetical protein [Marinomonas pontica]
MKDVNNLPHLSTMLCAIVLFLSLSACSNEADDIVGNSAIPSNTVNAVVNIASPKAGMLMQLRGIAGKGELVIKEGREQTGLNRCVASPIRFAAGDFNGNSIGIQSVETIRLLIYSDKIVEKLIAGEEIVSEDYVITDQNDDQLGDIKIESGLTLSYGFVLNPGEWSWSSVFGLDHHDVNCSLNSNALNRPT